MCDTALYCTALHRAVVRWLTRHRCLLLHLSAVDSAEHRGRGDWRP
jgi:hypothetical protein